MTVNISYAKNPGKISVNTVLFVDEKFNTNTLKKYISTTDLTYINDLLKTFDLKKKIFVFEINSKKKIQKVLILKIWEQNFMAV